MPRGDTSPHKDGQTITIDYMEGSVLHPQWLDMVFFSRSGSDIPVALANSSPIMSIATEYCHDVPGWNDNGTLSINLSSSFMVSP
jgi:hypothetical protein